MEFGSPFVTARADKAIPCLLPNGTSIFPFFTAIMLYIFLQISSFIISEECSAALDNIGSTTDSRLDFKRRLIVLQGPDVLNSFKTF